MCDHGVGRHVTSINGTLRCVLCGHRVKLSRRKPKIRLRDWPRELLDRHLARERWWNTPVLDNGTFIY